MHQTKLLEKKMSRSYVEKYQGIYNGNVASTSTGTGTLVVTGGIGTSGRVSANDVRTNNVAVLATTASTSTSTGALTISGGVGVSGNIYIGANTASTSTDTGTLVVTGGVGVSGSVNARGPGIGGYMDGATWYGPTSIITNPSMKLGSIGSIGGYGGVGLTNATSASTSTDTGTLVVEGGVGISGCLNIGGYVTRTVIGGFAVGNTSFGEGQASTSTSTGTLVVTGGVGVSGRVTSDNVSTGALAASGTVTMTQDTASTSTSTGTLVVTGGVGVSGNINVGGTFNVGTLNSTNLTVSGNLTVNGTTTTINSVTMTVDDNNIELGSINNPTDESANGGGITLKGLTDKTITWDSTNSNWTSSEHWNIASDKAFKINNINVLTSTQLGSAITFSSNTASTSTSTGTLVVTGGVGVSGRVTSDNVSTGALAASGAVTMTQGTASTSTSTGTLVVTGGVGVSGRVTSDNVSTGALAASGAVTMTQGTASTSTGTGTLVVTGGVGVSGVIHCKGIKSNKLNPGVTLILGATSASKVSIKFPIDFKSASESSMFQVPSNHMFLIDSMEVITTSISGAGTPPTVRLGNTSVANAYYGPTQITSNSVGARHIIENPQNGVTGGTTVTCGVTVASTATSHNGFIKVSGELIDLNDLDAFFDGVGIYQDS